MNRILFLDIARAVCIILVVIGHYLPDNAPVWYSHINSIIYTFHMPLFMFVSGVVYVLTKKNEGYGSFIIKKVKRLLIPYFSTSLIIITIKLLTQGSSYIQNPVTPLSYLKMFYLPEAGYFLWFIWALWWMFVLLPLFKTIRGREILFLASVVLHFIPIPLTQIFCIGQFKDMFVFFMLGVFIADHKPCFAWMQNFSFRRMTVCLTLWIVLLAAFSLLGDNLIFDVILPLAGIWGVVELSKYMCRVADMKKHWMFTVSVSSYIIYLFHTTFEGFAKAAFNKFPIEDFTWHLFIIQACIVIFIGLAAPVLLYRWVLVRFKTTKFLFGLPK